MPSNDSLADGYQQVELLETVVEHVLTHYPDKYSEADGVRPTSLNQVNVDLKAGHLSPTTCS